MTFNGALFLPEHPSPVFFEALPAGLPLSGPLKALMSQMETNCPVKLLNAATDTYRRLTTMASMRGAVVNYDGEEVLVLPLKSIPEIRDLVRKLQGAR